MPASMHLTRIALGLMALTLCSKALGFGREIVLAAQLGATQAGDAFKVAVFIPMMLFGVVAAALTNTFIPLMAEREIKAGRGSVESFVPNVSNVVTIILVLLAALGMMFTPWIVKVVAPGFKQETYRLTVVLTYWLMPSIAVMGFLGLTTGYLNFRGVFVLPAASGFVFNLLMISCLFLLIPKMGVSGAAAGTLFGYGGQGLFLLACAWRYGYRFRLSLDWRDPFLLRMAALAAPMILGTAVGVLAHLVDRIFASCLTPGSISALDYAVRLTDLALGIFVLVVGNVYLPSLSRHHTSRDWDAYSSHLSGAVTLVIYVMFPVTAWLMLVAQPIVSLCFERGVFDARATVLTGTALFYYAIGLVGFAFQDILSRAFYALQDTVTPVINGVFMVILNIMLNCLLIRVMGLGGIAFSTSIAATLMALYLLYRLRRKIAQLNLRPVWVAAVKSGLAVVIMAVGVKGLDCFLTEHLTGEFGLLFRVALDAFSGAILYLTLLYCLKVPELQNLMRRS